MVRLGSSGRPWGWWIAALVIGGATVLANPDEQDFEDFAAERLTLLVDQELCSRGGLPTVAQLLIQNCSELVNSQRAVLGRLALAGSSRINAGVFSLYNTQLGGQTLLPGLSLPRYRVLTLGVAGQLVILRASRDEG